jgi:hypothetical protein
MEGGGIALAGVALFIIFLSGVLFGVLVIAARSFNREDRRKSLKGTPPDAACGGTRWLVGVRRRDYQQAELPDRLDEEPGQRWGQGG